jgi:hypothetical protein
LRTSLARDQMGNASDTPSMLKILWIVLAVALLSGCPRPPGPACYTINGIPSTGCPNPRARATPIG